MDDITLNQMLLSAFPELRSRYKELFPWADEGEDEEPDGAHVVYGSLLENRIETLVLGHDYSEAKPYLDYCEKSYP